MKADFYQKRVNDDGKSYETCVLSCSFPPSYSVDRVETEALAQQKEKGIAADYYRINGGDKKAIT